jgi:N-acetylglucosaminyldiphosphoundecaprenol N-acetyl-beta-D-mannosaminyltransferase
MLQKKTNLFGLKIDDVSLDRALELAQISFISGESRVFFTPNLEMLDRARRNEDTRRILNSASVLLPDGAGVLLASRLLGEPIKQRVAGIDFGEGLISLCEREEKGVFLLGSGEGVAKKAAKNLMKKHPNLKIYGIHNGFFLPEDEDAIIEKIQDSNPDVLIVCMGFPRQERFVSKHKNDFSEIKVITCLGGALDVWAGRIKRAPRVMQRAHLEWLWRIINEPRRAKRFISSLPSLFHALWN